MSSSAMHAPAGPPLVLRARDRLCSHWPEYLIEAWALGTFMLSAGVFAVLIEHPGSRLHALVASAAARRALLGLAMGATAIALIYSPWGRRSGAHMNPAVTLAFLRLGRVDRLDAVFFVAAQFAGGLLGALAAHALLGERFSGPPVSFVATLPRVDSGVAFLLEASISCVLMTSVLFLGRRARLEPFVGIAAGALVALFIALESPYSGMSMNPARSFASAAPAGLWTHLWIYFTAPPIGMWAAAELHARLFGRKSAPCAKLRHARDVRCIHCGYVPSGSDSRAEAAASTHVGVSIEVPRGSVRGIDGRRN